MSTSKSSNKMGVVQLTILTAVNMMGSGIIMLPTKLAEVGTLSIVSWLVTALGSMALAYAFAKCGMFSRKSGGMGGYAEYAFGKSGNFMANYTYGVSLLIANVAIAISAVGYGTELMGANLTPLGICIATIGVLWLATIANFGGARITGRISGVTVWGVIIPVVGISIIGWFWFSPTMYVQSWNPHHLPVFEAVGSSIAMTLWAFLGLESACANTDVVD
ncbi:MAG: putrescine-ornithine antiporter, partial [Enterobacterales bacterium]|nr:putrescine-ornithine antiporter [Enterobacterales bacterium]